MEWDKFFLRVKDTEDSVKGQEELLKRVARRYADGDETLSELKIQIGIYERTEASLSVLESTLFELQIFPEYRGWREKYDEMVHRPGRKAERY